MSKERFTLDKIRRNASMGILPHTNETKFLIDTIDELLESNKKWRNSMVQIWDEVHNAGTEVAKSKRTVVKALRGGND